MNTYLLPCVGARFRKPAVALIQMCSTGTPVLLLPEPSNPFDPNAVQVILKSSDIPEESFEVQAELLEGFGYDKEGVLSQPSWHIGYIPATEAIWLQKKLPSFGLPGELAFDAVGRPAIKFSV